MDKLLSLFRVFLVLINLVLESLRHSLFGLRGIFDRQFFSWLLVLTFVSKFADETLEFVLFFVVVRSTWSILRCFLLNGYLIYHLSNLLIIKFASFCNLS